MNSDSASGELSMLWFASGIRTERPFGKAAVMRAASEGTSTSIKKISERRCRNRSFRMESGEGKRNATLWHIFVRQREHGKDRNGYVSKTAAELFGRHIRREHVCEKRNEFSAEDQSGYKYKYEHFTTRKQFTKTKK
jgi:hypothetical protein